MAMRFRWKYPLQYRIFEFGEYLKSLPYPPTREIRAADHYTKVGGR